MSRPNHALDQALAAIDTLRQEVAELRALQAPAVPAANTIQAVADPLQPSPPGTYREPGTGLLRSVKTGQPFYANADTRPYDVRNAEAKAERQAEEQAELGAMREGCPPGCIRLWDGIIRDEKSGKVREDLLPEAQTNPKLIRPTERSAPSLLIPPHPEQIDAGQDPNAMTDETAEILRLRRPDPVPAAVPHVAEPTPRNWQRDVPPDPIERFSFEPARGD